VEAAKKVASELKFSLIEGPYVPEEWFQATATLENEPEGGRRCPVCFKMRLEKTYRFLLDSGGDCFTTTLTMGSNKSAALMERLGREIGGDKFLLRDFKKRDGFKRAGELVRKWELYRQHYCGCKYSLNPNAKHPRSSALKTPTISEIVITQGQNYNSNLKSLTPPSLTSLRDCFTEFF